MNKLSLLFCSIIFLNMAAQSKITVLKAGEGTPITNATVSCNKKIVGKTNALGILQFRTKCKKVDVKAPGYYEDEAVVDQVMEIALSKG